MSRQESAKKVILWDFDGVILQSDAVRELGFRSVLAAYPQDQVDQLIAYHRQNGGLSRYVKFTYFFREILQQPLSESQLAALAAQFSALMMELLGDSRLLIAETTEFIRSFHSQFAMHIVSGSDQAELRKLCTQLGISSFFQSVQGSPTPKITLVRELIQQYGYDASDCLLIGDSINDYEAAKANGIDFMAYNNSSLGDLNTYVLDLTVLT